MPRIRDRGFLVELGQRLRARRQWLGLTLAQVGAEVAVEYQQIQKYETGLNEPRAAALVQLAEALKTTPHALLGWGISPAADVADRFFADPAVAAIVRRLRNMDTPQRKLAHTLICTVRL